MPDFDHSDSDPQDRRRAFFGRRKGHALKRSQAHLYETLLPRLAVDWSVSAPARLGELFPDNPSRIWLEIGFGGGEHLIAHASANPDIGFVGVEPFVNGMAKALVAIDANKLTNIRVHFDD